MNAHQRSNSSTQPTSSPRHPARNRLLLVAIGAILATFTAVPALAAAEAPTGVTSHPELTVSAAMRAHGPWGTTFISADVIDTGDGPVWAFCTQAPIPGGGQATETDLATMADANSDAVRANEHRIRWILTHNELPDPSTVLRLQPGIGIFDWQGNEVPREEVTAERPLVHQYAQGPEAGHSYYDSLPLPSSLRVEIAAVQAAVWHYSDGFDPDAGSSLSDQGLYSSWSLPWEAGAVTTAEVIERYRELVAAADAVPAPPAPSVDVEALGAGQGPGEVLFEVTAEGVDQVGVSSTTGSLHPYDSANSTCDTSTAVDSVDPADGPVVLCTVVTSSGEVVVTGAGTAIRDELVYIDRGSAQDLVTNGVRDSSATDAATTSVMVESTTTTSTTTSTTSTTSTTTLPSSTTTTPPEGEAGDPTSGTTTSQGLPEASVQRATISRTGTSTGASLAYTGASTTANALVVAVVALLTGVGALVASKGRATVRQHD